MLTRREASSVLYSIINSGIISDELESALCEIESCIMAEENFEIHAWGMPSEDFALLHTAMRTDHPDFDSFVNKQREIVDKYSFK